MELLVFDGKFLWPFYILSDTLMLSCPDAFCICKKNAYLGHLDIKVLELLWTKLIKIFRKNTIYILLTSKINKIQKKIILQILLKSRSHTLVILPYHLKKLATILKALRFKYNTNLKGRFFCLFPCEETPKNIFSSFQ